MADTKVYEGGIPNQGFAGTFPHASETGSMFQPDPTSGEVDTVKGGPATFSGSSDAGFLNDRGYEAPDEQRAGSMKVVDLDDIKSTV